MILNSLTVAGHIIFEAGEGHRWQFDYDNYNVDPKPDVLVLGTYKHPNTGNQLVGGINLHYISERDQLDLRKLLPELSKIKGLKRRYRFGSRALPHIFSDQAYRTYDSDHISGLKTGVLFPVYGVLSKDADKASKARSRKAAEKKSEPQVVAANRDIRNLENAYEKETAELAQEVPSDTSRVTPQDKEVIDRYAQIKDKADNIKNKDAVQLKAEKEYADTTDKEALRAATVEPVATTAVMPTPVKPTAPIPKVTAKQARPVPVKPIAKTMAPIAPTPSAPTQSVSNMPAPASVSPVVPKVPNIDYTKAANLNDRIEKAPLKSEYDELPVTDSLEVPQDNLITEVSKKYISYYSPRLRRHIIEVI